MRIRISDDIDCKNDGGLGGLAQNAEEIAGFNTATTPPIGGVGEEAEIRGQGASAQAGGKQRMEESCEIRPSQPSRPRVMRRVGQPTGRSVHRGTARLCIELRNHEFVVADLVLRKGRQQ